MQIGAEKVVSIHYVLTNEAGEQLDASQPDQPLDYLHGAGNIIPGLEQALEGKIAGDKLEVSIPPESAYGVRNDELVQIVPLEAFQEAGEVQVGSRFHASGPNGTVLVTVTQVTGEEVTVDGNHPLAGETLNFAVEVASVRDASTEELAHGHVHGEGGHQH